MLTSENKTSILSEDGKRMDQSPFLWEFPAKGSSYVLQVLQQHGLLDPLVGHGVRDVETAGLCHLVFCHPQLCGFGRHCESQPFQTLLYPDLPQSFSQSCPFLLYQPEWWI